MTGRDLPKTVREKLRQNSSPAGQGNTNVRLPDLDTQKKRPGFLSMLDDSYLCSQTLPEEDPTMKKSKYKGAYDKIFGPGSQAGSPAGGDRSPPSARAPSSSTGLASSALASSLSSARSGSPASAASPAPVRSPSSTSSPVSMSPPTSSLHMPRGPPASSPHYSGSPSGTSPQMVRSPYGSPGSQSTHSTTSIGSPQFRSAHGPKSSTPMRGDHNAFSFNVSELSHQSPSPSRGYDASGEPIRNRAYDESGEPIRSKGYDASGEPIRNNVTTVEQPIRSSAAFTIQASSEISYVSKPVANQSPVSRSSSQNHPRRSASQGPASGGATSLRASGAKAKSAEGVSGSAPKRNRNSAIMARAAFWDNRVDAGLASDKDVNLEFPDMPSDSFKR